MMKKHLWLLLFLPLLTIPLLPPLRTLTAQIAPQFGDPLPGLPDHILAQFQAGKLKFMEVQTPASGLGPVFNGRSCAECHSNPAVGGSSDIRVIRFGTRGEGGRFDPLLNLGGPNHQKFSVGGELPGCSLPVEAVPQNAEYTGLRQAPQLFGLGLIQAIPDSTILAGADPDDLNDDGIAGRANIDNGVIGRFGWKAAGPTLVNFVGLAMVNELGITNHLFPNEMSPQGKPIPFGCDIAADPEDADISRIAPLTFFVTHLGPPPRGPITDAVLRGEALFTQIGCALCHTPSMTTGPNALEALNQKDVPLFSNLLVHYMGGSLDDHIVVGAAGGGRWRTTPLWGLRARSFFLHDGRTTSLTESINLHGGESYQIRKRFFELPAAQRADVIAFLRSL
jgi:CxxC motif-containing protein (DUF1111 family)